MTEMEDLQRLAVAEAIAKAARTATDPRGGERGAENFRTRCDLALREDWERTGTDRRRISINGQEVGALSARLSKPVTKPVYVVSDLDAFVLWLQSDDGFEALRSVMSGAKAQEIVFELAEAEGYVPDGCRVEVRDVPRAWLGTTLRVKPQLVARALGAELPGAVAGLLGGGE